MGRPATSDMHVHAPLDRVLAALAGGVTAGPLTVTLPASGRDVAWTRSLTARRMDGSWRRGRAAGAATVDLLRVGGEAWTLASVTLTSGRGWRRRPTRAEAAAVLHVIRAAAEAGSTAAPAVDAAAVVVAGATRPARPAVGYSRV